MHEPRLTRLVRLVELEVGDLLKALAVAGKQRQVMLQSSGGNQNVHIADLLSDLAGQRTPNDSKVFHHCLAERQDLFAFQEGV